MLEAKGHRVQIWSWILTALTLSLLKRMKWFPLSIWQRSQPKLYVCSQGDGVWAPVLYKCFWSLRKIKMKAVLGQCLPFKCMSHSHVFRKNAILNIHSMFFFFSLGFIYLLIIILFFLTDPNRGLVLYELASTLNLHDIFISIKLLESANTEGFVKPTTWTFYEVLCYLLWKTSLHLMSIGVPKMTRSLIIAHRIN